MTDLVELQDVGKYLSVTAIVWVLADVAGPLLGGVFAQSVFRKLPMASLGNANMVLQIRDLEMVLLDQLDHLPHELRCCRLRLEAPRYREDRLV